MHTYYIVREANLKKCIPIYVRPHLTKVQYYKWNQTLTALLEIWITRKANGDIVQKTKRYFNVLT